MNRQLFNVYVCVRPNPVNEHTSTHHSYIHINAYVILLFRCLNTTILTNLRELMHLRPNARPSTSIHAFLYFYCMHVHSQSMDHNLRRSRFHRLPISIVLRQCYSSCVDATMDVKGDPWVAPWKWKEYGYRMLFLDMGTFAVNVWATFAVNVWTQCGGNVCGQRLGSSRNNLGRTRVRPKSARDQYQASVRDWLDSLWG